MDAESGPFAPLRARIRQVQPIHHLGRVCELGANCAHVRGLCAVARLGDEISLVSGSGAPVRAAVTQIAGETLIAVPYVRLDGMKIGAAVTWHGPPCVWPHRSWLGRVIDAFGDPLDGRPLMRGAHRRDLHADPPDAHARRPLGDRLQTGLGVMDTMLPLVRGQRVGLFAGSGVGKSSLLAHMARRVEADVSVVALIGERGRELSDFLRKTLGPNGLRRSVVVAATSDQAAGVRHRALALALGVAEHFRDEGAHVLFLADSLTRFAEAHRDIAVVTGEPAHMRGYPASLTHALARACERAGPGTGQDMGDITAVFSVLVAGSDMEEPVADIVRGLLDGHIVLDRQIAENGRYPAVDVLRSVSRALPDAASTEENRILDRARALLGAYDRSELMIRSGLYEKGSDPALDCAIAAHAKIEAFFADPQRRSIQESFAQLGACLDP